MTDTDTNTNTDTSARAREILGCLIGFDTTSRNSNMALIEWVQGYLADLGVESTLAPNDDGDKANIFSTIGPTGDGGIVLSGHTDVVPVDGQAWDSDPFELTERDGRLFGRGTCDMKGFIALALAMAPEFLAAGLKTPVHYAFSFDEEIGCAGVPKLLTKIARELPQPRLALIGEPTEMRVVNAHKGITALETAITGLEAHSSLKHISVNAIEYAVRMIGFILELAERYRLDPVLPEFEPPYTTFNIGSIDGGTAVNITAKECRFVWEFRPVPGVREEDIRAEIDRFVEREILPPMRDIFPEASVTTTPMASAPPLTPEENGPAEELIRRLTGANQTGTVSFATEAGLFQDAGMSAVVCGPGSIAQAHQPNEYIDIAQLDAGEALLRKLRDWAAGNAPA